jgi:hypothetical protein
MTIVQKTINNITIGVVLLLCASTTSAVERYVPGQYATIQAAIDDCVAGDVVIIAPGTYSGSGNRQIYLWGKAITVRGTDPEDPKTVANTIIDCQQAGCGFIFRMREGTNSIISGLTIANGRGYSLLGGAIYCVGSSPQITNCVIRNNYANCGGAVWCAGSSSPEITNCIVSDNSALIYGGAIYCNGGSPKISNCVIAGNAALSGAGIYCLSTSAVIQNCTFNGNAGTSSSSGIHGSSSSNLIVNNSILWTNMPQNGHQVLLSSSGGASSLDVSYCNVRGGISAVLAEAGCTLKWGAGNLDPNPMFAGGPWGDYYLERTSACVDAGSDLASKLGLDKLTTQTDGQRDSGLVDMGYHYPSNAVTVAAVVEIKPDTLNVESQGQWITCYIWLPEGCNVDQIDPGTILLAGQIKPDRFRIDEEAQVAIAKFARQVLANNVESAEVQLAVSGMLADGTNFQGADVIRVIGNGSKKK